MAFRVFLSYSLHPSEQALAWRLQTLAAAHGIEMYVPRRKAYLVSLDNATLQVRYSEADRRDREAMERSDCVLAIIAPGDRQSHGSVREELRRAAEMKKKPIIPIIWEGLEQADFLKPLRRSSSPLFVLSPQDGPGKVEGEVVEFLKKQRLNEDNRRTIAALVALAVGQLLLFSLSEK